jgi:hypothetical protein
MTPHIRIVVRVLPLPHKSAPLFLSLSYQRSIGCFKDSPQCPMTSCFDTMSVLPPANFLHIVQKDFPSNQIVTETPLSALPMCAPRFLTSTYRAQHCSFSSASSKKESFIRQIDFAPVPHKSPPSSSYTVALSHHSLFDNLLIINDLKSKPDPPPSAPQ